MSTNSKGQALHSEKSDRTQLTFSLTQKNKDKLQRIATQKGMTMAGDLSSWIAEYSEKDEKDYENI